MKVTTREHKGQSYDINVDDRGTFSVTIGDATLTADTINEVVEKAERQLKQRGKKLNIRAAKWDGRYGQNKVTRGSFTGFHAGTNNFLFKPDSEKGVKQIWNSDARENFVPEEFADEYEVLGKTAVAAIKARDAFLNKHRLDFGKLVNEALNKEVDDIV